VVEVTKVQLLMLVNTLVAVALGWVVLGEQMGLRGFLGAAAVLGGLAITLSVRPRPTPGHRLPGGVGVEPGVPNPESRPLSSSA
jgi:drug/metabolite transporter (DMT)-like permease